MKPMLQVRTSPEEDLQLLRACAVTAGIIAVGYFRRDVRNWTKGEAQSPVSEADVVLDQHLHAQLIAARPEYGWLSEETADNDDRLTRERVFIVDPIDGTRGFIKGEDAWCVSLAVVEHGLPIAGVVYAPARDEMYEASLEGGARLNGATLERKTPIARTRPVIPGPGAAHQALQAGGLNYARGPYYPSLAYRLVQVATGKLDAAVARRGSNDWDIAGAAIVLSEAGVLFEDVCAGTVRFNMADVRHGALAAVGAPSLRTPVHEALIKVYGCPA
jgi:myo-inositol-1(or 4)-monophosphatase